MKGVIQSFGIAVRQLREQQGWSQEQLAEHSDLNRSYVGEVERGSVIPSIVTAHKLAQALSLPASGLLAHSEALERQRTAIAIDLMAIAC